MVELQNKVQPGFLFDDKRQYRPLSGLVLSIVCLSGCLTLDSRQELTAAAEYPQSLQQSSADATIGVVDRSGLLIAEDANVGEVINLLMSGDYETASRWLNRALLYEIDSATYQFLNGLTYHLMSARDVSKRPLAKHGYQMALRFDESHWLAYYFLGILDYESRRYQAALENIAQAFLLMPENDLILSDLGRVAYYAGKPAITAGVYGRLLQDHPDNAMYLSNYAVALAALGLSEDARQAIARLDTDTASSYAGQRVNQWRNFYQRASSRHSDGTAEGIEYTLAGEFPAADTGSAGAMHGAEPDTGRVEQAAPEPAGETPDKSLPQEVDAADRMVLLDVVIIRSEEAVTRSRGVNLLDGLMAQFGYEYSRSRNWGSLVERGTAHSVVSVITAQGIEYSLNIANSLDYRNEILAQPSLLATDGQASNFFSGININAAAVGGGLSGEGAVISLEKDIGVSLKLEPHFLDENRVRLKIEAERTALAFPNETSVTFELRIDTTKTRVSADIVMEVGETAILSGLNERELDLLRSDVPVLGKIPVIQYLFANKKDLDFQRSILIVITPRHANNVLITTERGHTESAAVSPGVAELTSSYNDWFYHNPNLNAVTDHLARGSYNRQFRVGDMTADSSNREKTLKARLGSFFGKLRF